MRLMLAGLLSIALAACSDPVGVGTAGLEDPAMTVATQAKPVVSLVIETISGDCASGITVRVTGQNLSAKSRFGNQWLHMSDLTSVGPAQVELGKGSKKSVEWTVFWPSTTISPASGGRFNGWAEAVVTDNWTGWVHQSPPTFIGPTC